MRVCDTPDRSGANAALVHHARLPSYLYFWVRRIICHSTPPLPLSSGSEHPRTYHTPPPVHVFCVLDMPGAWRGRSETADGLRRGEKRGKHVMMSGRQERAFPPTLLCPSPGDGVSQSHLPRFVDVRCAWQEPPVLPVSTPFPIFRPPYSYSVFPRKL